MIFLAALIFIYEAKADERCPDYRITDGSRYACGYSAPTCASAGANDATCEEAYSCEGIVIGDVAYDDNNYDCVRCNSEDGWRGRIPFCISRYDDYEGEDGEENVDDFNGELGGLIDNDDYELLFAGERMGEVIVLNSDDDRCCAEEGERNETWKPCCDGMPNDWDHVGSGICGCPNKMEWDVTSEQCIPNFQTCGLSNDVQVCNSLIDILTHPLDCLRRLSGDRNPPPYEQACCPYIDYEGEEYYRFMDVEVY